MIKARGENHVLLGLSHKNLERLKAGDPIRFDGKEINFPGITFLIVAGKTEEVILEDLRKAGILKL